VRRHLSVLVLVASTTIAAADDKASTKIDVSAIADKLDVFRDDTGNYYIAPRLGSLGTDSSAYRDRLFYGDGKLMYQQRVIGFSQMKGEFDWTVWSPRVREQTGAAVTLTKTGLALGCAATSTRALTQLPASEASEVIARATFQPPLWQRLAMVLARDDDGVYYYVDELRKEAGGKGYRLFVGRKGAMKELTMTDVVVDKNGEIFTTKTGSLKLAGDKAWWQTGKSAKATKTELIALELERNRYVIYRELGIYGQLGTVCEDQ
jgi:hypothetical protein